MIQNFSTRSFERNGWIDVHPTNVEILFYPLAIILTRFNLAS